MSDTQKLGNELHGCFYQAFRNVGTVFNIKQSEALRTTCFRIAETVNAAARNSALELSKALEDEVHKAVKRIATDIEKLEKEQAEIKELLQKLGEQVCESPSQDQLKVASSDSTPPSHESIGHYVPEVSESGPTSNE